MSDLLPVSLEEMASEAAREVAIRAKAYPRWVREGRMKPDRAERGIEVMAAIADYLNNQIGKGPAGC